jgi:hypothetical protein
MKTSEERLFTTIEEEAEAPNADIILLHIEDTTGKPDESDDCGPEVLTRTELGLITLTRNTYKIERHLAQIAKALSVQVGLPPYKG